MRHSVHFGEEEDGNGEEDQTEERIKTKEEEPTKVTKDEDKPNTCLTHTVPIIKVGPPPSPSL